MAFDLYFIIWFLLGLLIGLVNFIFAIAVYENANLIKSTARKSTFLVSPAIWALATIIFGVIAVGIYWLIHYSTLKPDFEYELKKVKNESKEGISVKRSD